MKSILRDKKNRIAWNKGKKTSEETKKKLSEALKGKIPWIKGKHHTKETKLRMSKARSGINNPNYGKRLAEETKRKIGEANKGKQPRLGKKLSEESKLKISRSHMRKIPWNRSIPRSKETKNKIGKANKNRLSGKNHPNWKGGLSSLIKNIRNSFKYRQWRSDIFTRDHFTCQKCGQIGVRLNAHHIKSFSEILQFYEIITLEEALECEEIWNINNGITLCKKCHKKTESYLVYEGNNQKR